MDGLRDEFAGEIDFFLLDIDKPETEEVRKAYGMTGRSHYVLIDANGDVVRSWFGPLQPTMDEEMRALLEGLAEEE